MVVQASADLKVDGSVDLIGADAMIAGLGCDPPTRHSHFAHKWATSDSAPRSEAVEITGTAGVT